MNRWGDQCGRGQWSRKGAERTAPGSQRTSLAAVAMSLKDRTRFLPSGGAPVAPAPGSIGRRNAQARQALSLVQSGEKQAAGC